MACSVLASEDIQKSEGLVFEVRNLEYMHCFSKGSSSIICVINTQSTSKIQVPGAYSAAPELESLRIRHKKLHSFSFLKILIIENATFVLRTI